VDTKIEAIPNSESPADPYSLRFVETELRVRSIERSLIHSWTQKRLVRMGDVIGVALLKLLSEEEIRNPRTIRDALPIMRNCFDHPELISIESDKKPKVTNLLLHHLLENIQDSDARREIQETLDFIAQKTGCEPPSNPPASLLEID
jgi:hypothetical protein